MLAACPDGIRALADENARWPLGISIGRVPDRGIGKLMIPPADSQQSAGLRGPDGRISPATSTLYTWKNGSDASPARQILRLGNPGSTENHYPVRGEGRAVARGPAVPWGYCRGDAASCTRTPMAVR